MTAVALAFVLPRLWRGAPPRAPISRTAMNADIYRSELAELEPSGIPAGSPPPRLPKPRDRTRAPAARRCRRRNRFATARRRHAARRRRRSRSRCRSLAARPLRVFGEPGALATRRADAGFAATGAALDRAGHARGTRAPSGEQSARRPRLGAARPAGRSRTTASPRPPPPSNARSPIAPKVAADAAIWCEYADALGMAQGGSARRQAARARHARTGAEPGAPQGAGNGRQRRLRAARVRCRRPLLADAARAAARRLAAAARARGGGRPRRAAGAAYGQHAAPRTTN